MYMYKDFKMERHIKNAYRDYGVNITLHLIKIIDDDHYIFEVQLEDDTLESAVFKRAVEVMSKLHIPLIITFKEHSRIFLRISLNKNINCPLIPMLNYIQHTKSNHPLTFALGYDLMHNMVYDNLNEMPHLMCTGATSSGKSVSLLSIIISLAYTLPVQYVNFVIFDVGGTSLSCFEELPHLSYPIVKELNECLYVIEKLSCEMNRRLMLSQNELDSLPSIVCVIDEFVYLSEHCPIEFCDMVSDILRRGRKSKIHMVLATQSSQKNELKIAVNNITAKMAFKCSNYYESIAAINSSGAEKLLGKGDMLYKPYDSVNLERLQGAYISNEECCQLVKEIADAMHIYDLQFIIPKPNLSLLSPNIPEVAHNIKAQQNNELSNIIMWVLENDEVSVDRLKKNFSKGNIANNIMQQLCEYGLVSEPFAKRPRKVLPKSLNDISQEVIDLLNNNGISHEMISTVLENKQLQLLE